MNDTITKKITWPSVTAVLTVQQRKNAKKKIGLLSFMIGSKDNDHNEFNYIWNLTAVMSGFDGRYNPGTLYITESNINNVISLLNKAVNKYDIILDDSVPDTYSHIISDYNPHIKVTKNAITVSFNSGTHMFSRSYAKEQILNIISELNSIPIKITEMSELLNRIAH